VRAAAAADATIRPFRPEDDRRTGLADLEACEKLGEPVQLDDNCQHTGKIEADDDRRRGRDRRPVAIRQVRKHTPTRAILGDGTLVPCLRGRVVIARGDLPTAKQNITGLRRIGIDPLLPNSRLGVFFTSTISISSSAALSAPKKAPSGKPMAIHDSVGEISAAPER
jgi:hypothetical protein